ncbi:MAG: hypothetical protein M3N32_03955 [Actinomycetota bacterium]|nr:hypothetical protein [Actinomycetota bacterium]
MTPSLNRSIDTPEKIASASLLLPAGESSLDVADDAVEPDEEGATGVEGQERHPCWAGIQGLGHELQPDDAEDDPGGQVQGAAQRPLGDLHELCQDTTDEISRRRKRCRSEDKQKPRHPPSTTRRFAFDSDRRGEAEPPKRMERSTATECLVARARRYWTSSNDTLTGDLADVMLNGGPGNDDLNGGHRHLLP